MSCDYSVGHFRAAGTLDALHDKAKARFADAVSYKKPSPIFMGEERRVADAGEGLLL